VGKRGRRREGGGRIGPGLGGEGGRDGVREEVGGGGGERGEQACGRRP
jgi:hypothetical protein